jgi:hypothetical protein
MHQLVGGHWSTAPFRKFLTGFLNVGCHSLTAGLSQAPGQNGNQFLLLIHGQMIGSFQHFAEWHDLAHGTHFLYRANILGS